MNAPEDNELAARVAALRREIPPPDDQWPVIAARIARRRARVPTWFGGFATAAVVAVVVLGLTAQLFGERPAPAGAGVSVGVDPALQQGLDVLLEGRVDLSTMTVAMLRANLALVDNALHDISTALELDPSNPSLQEQLHDTYRGQAELLDTLRRAPHGT